MRRQITRTILAALAVAASSACAGADAFRPLAVGDEAPHFAGVTLDGDSLSLADFKGGPILVNIWATWCAPCRSEMPEIEELYQEYQAQGFRVVGVSIDNRGAADQIAEFAEEIGVSFTILHDPEQSITRNYQTIGVPESFLIDGDGVLMARWTGRFAPLDPDVKALVEEALAKAE